MATIWEILAPEWRSKILALAKKAKICLNGGRRHGDPSKRPKRRFAMVAIWRVGLIADHMVKLFGVVGERARFLDIPHENSKWSIRVTGEI